jgi:Domain of unknown function (DUF5655)
VDVRTVDDFFAGKPETFQQFRTIANRIDALGPYQVTVGSQISFAVKRKFAWFWLYNVTKKNPNGVLHIMLAIDHRIDDPHLRDISQISRRRWNHQVVIRSSADARSAWLGKLIEPAYRYGSS